MQYLDKFPAHFQQSPEFREAWGLWLDYRKSEKKKPVGPIAARLQAKELSLYSIKGAVAMIHAAIKKGYQGVFPVKEHLPTQKPVQPPKRRNPDDLDRIPAEELAKLTASIRAKGFPEARKQNEDERRAELRGQIGRRR